MTNFEFLRENYDSVGEYFFFSEILKEMSMNWTDSEEFCLNFLENEYSDSMRERCWDRLDKKEIRVKI
jgi:hypothetical protein